MREFNKTAIRGSTALRAALLAGGCMLGLAGAAAAQEGEPATEVDAVIITAQRAVAATKSDTLLTEIPQSISVVTAQEIQDRTVVDLQDIFRYSAGVAASTSVDSRADMVAARGFEAEQYLDGLKRTPTTIYGARLEPFTLGRAEVLRGPSSVLYGAGGPGGVLNGASKTPEFSFGGEVGLVLGSDARVQAQADITGAFTDNVAGRLVVLARDAETQWGLPDDRLVINPSLTWRIGERSEWTLIGLYQDDAQASLGYLPLRNSLLASSPAEQIDFYFYSGEPDFAHMDTQYTALTSLFTHRFSPNITFNSRMRYSKMDVDYAEVYMLSDPGIQFADPAQTLINRAFYVNLEQSSIFNADNNVSFRVNTGGFEHNILVGLDYTWVEQDKNEGYSCYGWPFAPCWAGPGPGPLDIRNPQYGVPFTFGATNPLTYEGTQLGVYVQDQISFANDRVHLLLGARHDTSTGEADGVSELDQSAWSFRGGLIGELFPGFSPYVSYSESFTPVPDTDFYGNAYVPQTGRQYEVGFKWEPRPGALVTLSYFDIEEENYISQDPTNIQNFVQGGSVGSTGVEAEVAVRLPGEFDFFASYSYTDAQVLTSSQYLTAGQRIAELPQHLASIWFGRQFSFGNDWTLRTGGGVRYVGDRIDSSQFLETPAVTLVDAMVALERGNWSLSVNASNLFNEQYYSICHLTGAPDVGYCVPAKDRTLLVSLTRRF